MTDSPSNTFPAADLSSGQRNGVTEVGQVRHGRELAMNPADLEAHIAYCGQRMEEAYADFELTRSTVHRARAGKWRVEMERAIAAREGLPT